MSLQEQNRTKFLPEKLYAQAGVAEALGKKALLGGIVGENNICLVYLYGKG